ncbi:MAG: thermonuclease family protein [Candidatus Aquicultor sp.]
MRRYSKKLRPLSPAATVILIAFGLIFVLSRSGCSKPITSTMPKDTIGQSATSERAVYVDKGTGHTQESRDTQGVQDAQDTTPDNQHAQIAEVTRVVDGDTIVVAMNRKLYKVRFIGMDTPERGRPFYREATDKTKELVLGKQVRMVKDIREADRYGRLLRYVYADGVFVNAELVRQGYAVQATFPPDVKYVELFRKLAAEARDNAKGLWATD